MERAQTKPSLLLAAGLSLAAAGLSLAQASVASASPDRPGEQPGASSPAASKQEGAAFVVELKAPGKYKAGKEGKVELTLKPKDGYKVNKLYPYKFKLPAEPRDGVSFPKPLLKKDDFKLDEKSASVEVPFVAEKAGKARVGGTFSLSVCSESNCVMEKVELEVEVDVK